MTSYGENLVAHALTYLRSTLAEPGAALQSPEDVRNYLRLHLAGEKSEVFTVLFLNAKHGVLAFENIFQGTVNGASVYPREVARRCLIHNAAAVIVAHNHPSGDVQPSKNDIALTHRLKEGLAILDVVVLDHFIVGGTSEIELLSMAEEGHF